MYDSGLTAQYDWMQMYRYVVSGEIAFIVCKFGLKPLPFRQAVSNLSSGWLGRLV